MSLDFQRGERARPKGHAILYFYARPATGATPPREHDQILATYLVVPPIALDLAKYMPPLLAAKVPLEEMQTVTAVPLPPVPEQLPSQHYLEQLAEARDDDILFGGYLDASDVPAALQSVGEVAQSYYQAWTEFAATLEREAPVSEKDLGPFLYSMMSERERLGELTRLVGTLRYAAEAPGGPLVQETVEQMRLLAQHLPEKYALDELIRTASLPGEAATRLSDLYIRRCYLLCDEDYRSLEQLEQQIKEARSRLGPLDTPAGG